VVAEASPVVRGFGRCGGANLIGGKGIYDARWKIKMLIKSNTYVFFDPAAKHWHHACAMAERQSHISKTEQ
jgi:hypothetical protein